MSRAALSPRERTLIEGVFERYPMVESVRLFGSRAKGTHSVRSDVDLAAYGPISILEAERIRADLDELPLPYHFDVQPFDRIAFEPLAEHIERVGVLIYTRATPGDEAHPEASGTSPGRSG
jgi:proline iminopeptidase